MGAYRKHFCLIYEYFKEDVESVTIANNLSGKCEYLPGKWAQGA